MPDFAKALALVLKYEGGKVDRKDDPGGRTCQGVTQATFDAWCSSNNAGKRDVFDIAPAEVEAVYHNRYASAIHFDELPEGVGFCVFDAAVNSGPHKAAEWLQRAVNVPVDGIVGPATVAAAQKQGAFATINTVCDARLAFLQRLSTWATFGHGWGSRVDDVRKNATAMAHAAGTGAVAVVSPPSVIDKPANATDVRWLQETLSDLGYYRGPVDANFGPYTETAVKGFQLAHGLVVDGIVGDATRAAINAAKIVMAAASPAPSPGLGRIPEPPSLLPPGFIAPKAPPAPYTPPAVPGPHLVPAVSRPGFWARLKAVWQGKAA